MKQPIHATLMYISLCTSRLSKGLYNSKELLYNPTARPPGGLLAGAWSFAQLNAVKEQVEGAQGALRKVETSKLTEVAADGQA